MAKQIGQTFDKPFYIFAVNYDTTKMFLSFRTDRSEQSVDQDQTAPL